MEIPVSQRDSGQEFMKAKKLKKRRIETESMQAKVKRKPSQLKKLAVDENIGKSPSTKTSKQGKVKVISSKKKQKKRSLREPDVSISTAVVSTKKRKKKVKLNVAKEDIPGRSIDASAAGPSSTVETFDLSGKFDFSRSDETVAQDEASSIFRNRKRKLHTREKKTLRREQKAKEWEEREAGWAREETDREKAQAEYRQAKKRREKLLSKKNKFGQPKLGYHVMYLLEKLEKGMEKERAGGGGS